MRRRPGSRSKARWTRSVRCKFAVSIERVPTSVVWTTWHSGFRRNERHRADDNPRSVMTAHARVLSRVAGIGVAALVFLAAGASAQPNQSQGVVTKEVALQE